MADYDAIVVGAGLAGSTAAYCMAKAGLSVLVVERGDTPGSKNVTGGRIYANYVEKLFPGFAEEAPVQRKVVKERVSMMADKSCWTMDFTSSNFDDPANASYTVLRNEFDAWLSGKAEEAGCDVVCPAVVDEILMEDGKVIGVRAGEDELTADVVILADGVNSLLAQQLGMKDELKRHFVAVGAKEIVELPKDVINERFQLNDGEGCAHMFAGPTDGQFGGGILYTNKDTLCVGLVMSVEGICKASTRLPDLVENFRNSAPLKPLLEGGKVVEYSAHLVPEAGLHMIATLSRDNVLVVGDAAGLVINVGYTVRGMDFAMASGEMAAQTVIEAKEKGDFSNATLSAYKKRLEDSFVMQTLRTYKNAPDFLEHTPRLFNEYPKMLEDIFTGMYTVSDEKAKLMVWKALPILRKVGLFGLAKDGFKAVRAI